jgi:hypothetical protein
MLSMRLHRNAIEQMLLPLVLRLSVNVSVRQKRLRPRLSDVQRRLRLSGVPPRLRLNDVPQRLRELRSVHARRRLRDVLQKKMHVDALNKPVLHSLEVLDLVPSLEADSLEALVLVHSLEADSLEVLALVHSLEAPLALARQRNPLPEVLALPLPLLTMIMKQNSIKHLHF